MDPLTQLETVLTRYYARIPEPRSCAGAPREPLIGPQEFDEEPWPSDETIEWQRAEFEARARWYGYGAVAP